MKKELALVSILTVFSLHAICQIDVYEERTTTTTTTNDNINTNINMGIPGGGINVNMNLNMPGTIQSSTTTTTTTTTTGGYQQAPPPPPPPQPRPSGNGCYGPCGASEFQSVKGSISSKPFEDNKVQIAKQFLGANCVSAAQVRDLMGMFTYEESKLDIAKFAYGRCVDPNNYYKVNDGFTFSSSIDDLNEFIGSR